MEGESRGLGPRFWGMPVSSASRTSLSQRGSRGNQGHSNFPERPNAFSPVSVSKETDADYRAPRGTNIALEKVALATFHSSWFQIPSAGPAYHAKELCHMPPLSKPPSRPSPSLLLANFFASCFTGKILGLCKLRFTSPHSPTHMPPC